MSHLESLQDLPEGCRVALYGAGEFAGLLVRRLRSERSDIGLVCFADTFKTGVHAGLPVVQPEELARLALERGAVDLVLITAGDHASVCATLDGLGVRNRLAVGPRLRMEVNAPEGVRFVRSLAELPAGVEWTAVGEPEALERLRRRTEHGGGAPGIRACLRAERPERPEPAAGTRLLVLGSHCWRALASRLPRPEDPVAPVCVLDDPDLLDAAQYVRLLREQVDANLEIWKGGYREGDPLDPLSPSKYNHLGWISSLHVVHLTCIRPYVGPGTVALEIGCGGGAWSRAMASLAPEELWCVDVLSAEETGFWEYVGKRPGLRHVRVPDLSCALLPDGHFDYFFSYGCFCHLSPFAVREYLTNLVPKLKPGARGFLMVADYGKHNHAQLAHRDSLENLVPAVLRPDARALCSRLPACLYDVNEDQSPRPGRWYHTGVDAVCALLSGLGLEIVERDMEVNVRDPLIHFRKP